MTDSTHSGLAADFSARFGNSAEKPRAFHTPGRVNLIGEYTDFNGGLVFPCAIENGTSLLLRASVSGNTSFVSTNFDFTLTLQHDELLQKIAPDAIANPEDDWTAYPLGVLQQFCLLKPDLPNLQLLYSGDVPNGAGLSSSASIEVLTAFAINELFGYGLSRTEIALLAQAAENHYVGVQCGIMDQYAVAMANSDHAMALDCASLECQQVPMTLGDYRLIISNTNQRRELGDSAYNERVSECNTALRLLNTSSAASVNAKNLAQITPQQFESNRHLLDGFATEHKRARHVIEEQDRVLRAVNALRRDDLPEFGKLMNQSHESLRDLFEVSSIPLDCLVRLARQSPGVLGSRMTGAGFGGCTISLVHCDHITEFKKTVGEKYLSETGLTADFYQTRAADGAREIALA